MFTRDLQHAVLRWGRRIVRALRATTAATLWVPTVVKVLSVFERPMRVTTVDDHCRLFFSTLFRRLRIFRFFPKNVIGPEASEKHFGSSGGVREQADPS